MAAFLMKNGTPRSYPLELLRLEAARTHVVG
jgi:hypothetical protein